MASPGRIFKSLGHGLFVFLLSTTAFTGIIIITLSLTATNKGRVQSWPQRAGVYDHVTDNILNLAEHGSSNQDGQEQDDFNALFSSTTLDVDGVESAAESVYTPSYWQEKFNGFTDDVYAWLEGETERLEYELDFNDKKDELASALSAEIANQLGGLSTCQPHEIPRQFDALNADCLPPGVTATQAARQLERELTGGDGPLAQDLRVSSEDTDESSADEQVGIQDAYQGLKSAPFVVGGLLLLFALLVAVTGRSFLHGVRRAGVVLFSAGVISWISFFLLNQLGKFSPSIGQNEAERQINETILRPLAQTVVSDVAGIGMWTALTVVIAGALLWLGAYTWHKVHHHSEAEKIAQRAMANQEPRDNATLPKPVDPSASKQSRKS